MNAERVALRVKRLDKDLPLPRQVYDTDAGSDLYATEDMVIAPGETVKIPTNVAIELIPGTFGRVSGRSGLSSKGLLVHPGTVDADYRGQVMVIATNLNREQFEIKRGSRVAQLIVQPCFLVDWVEADDLTQTSRGERGFGSSGR